MADEAASVGGTSSGLPAVDAMVVAVLSVGRMQAAVDGRLDGWVDVWMKAGARWKAAVRCGVYIANV